MKNTNNIKYLTAQHLLIDHQWMTDHALTLEDGVIRAVSHLRNLPSHAAITDLGYGYLAPGFFDIQVNGGGGVLLNDMPTKDGILKIYHAHQKLGTTSFLPTLITDQFETMSRVADAFQEVQQDNHSGVRGLHFEGPYLNKDRKGVHNENHIRNFEDRFIDLLTENQLGNVLVTLAPEQVSTDFITALVQLGVVVAAGHTNANYQQTKTALEAGLTGFTHLYNAMPPMLSREPGIVGAALEDQDSYCGIIADGFHVHPATLKNVIASKSTNHVILVSDAMPCVGSSDPEFLLQGQKIQVENGKCTTESGTLAGSAISLSDAVQNSCRLLGQSLEDSAKMASETPARFMGLSGHIGTLSPGRDAEFVLLDQNGAVQQVLTTF